MASLTSPPPSFLTFHPRQTRLFSSSTLQFLPLPLHLPPRTIKLQHKRKTVECRVTNPNPPSSTALTKEPHKYFDHVTITVRGGDGGHGSILNQKPKKEAEKGKKGKGIDSHKRSALKRDFDGSVILPMGGHGGDVVIYADESKDTLLEFHNKNRFNAKRGGNVDAVGVFTSYLRNGIAAPAVRIAVPLGTVVKSKRGKMLADLARHGDEVLVARGGQGGISLLEMPKHNRKKTTSLTTNMMRDDSDKVLVHGQPGEEVKLELTLRVVADVGLVGLPNAGKSTLLGAITLAKPDIADYPFTTLMPNLGRLDGDPNLGAGMYSSEATLADLPGLIEGAHLGKGLGRNFLRHLRRTRLLVHVVDASTENPVNDYRTVREELRMYNPEYLERPYIVVLNKIDLPEVEDKLPILTQEILRIGSDGTASASEQNPNSEIPAQLLSDESDTKEKKLEDYPRPHSVIGVSVLKRIRIKEMLKEIRAALRHCNDSNGALASSVVR
ncbi:probable GTP-binding protein OBGC2 [Vicia villosa]|uniref:probable GTP-binding protein OBGC2 n=1 Tax=Vicia villosa TaxID=3911 RepID=UPI00273B061E|nr:probable GTP-binding protein OBGC2 [Vicia villosa]